MGIKNVDILIADADPITAEISKDLLLDAGFSVYLLQKPLNLIPELKKRKPKLLVMDIMLPGINGLRMCKLIKDNPGIRGIKIVIASQKNFEFEKLRAFKHGAEAFIPKPYNTETFAQQISHILAGTKNLAVSARENLEAEEMEETITEPSGLKDHEIRITVWGGRGLPASVPDSESAYGRQTSCVSVETADSLFIFDAGTGIIPLGEKIQSDHGPKDFWLLLSHFHLDHIIGLPKFAPLENASSTIRIAGCGESEKTFKETLREIFYGSPFWPAKAPKAKLMMYEVMEESYDLTKQARVSAIQSNHPSPTLGFALEIYGKKIVYVPDSEVIGDCSAMENYDERLAAFCQDADVLIHDAFYTDEDYKTHSGEGHSGISNAAELAAKAGAKKLILFHFNGSYPDETIELAVNKASKSCEQNGCQTEIIPAKENMSVII